MDSIRDYKRLEFELHEYLVQLKDMLLLLNGSSDYLQKIDNDIEYIKSKRFQVAVIGEFKRGKSSLINALLGSDILPSDVTPTTATINRITYGNDASAILLYKDGTSEKTGIDKLADYVTKLSENSEEQSRRIKEAVITYPLEICRNNIEVIDTPGLNDDEKMTEVTLDALNNIDAAIVTISAVSPVSGTEQSLIAQLIRRKNIGAIVFAVTYIDQIDEEDRERLFDNIKQRIAIDTRKLFKDDKEEIQRKADIILDHIQLYGISSKQALKAISMNKQKLLNESGFDEFRNALYQVLISEQGMLAIRKSIDAIYDMVEELSRQHDHNETEYRKMLSISDDILNTAIGYKNSVLLSIDRGFSKVDDKLEPQLNSASVLLKLIQFYISHLSALKSNSHQDIIKATTDALNECNEYIKVNIQPEREKIITENLFEALQEYKENLKIYLHFLETYKLDQDILSMDLKLYRIELINIKELIKIPEFTHDILQYQRRAERPDYNIIKDIREVLRVAVSAYDKSWDEFVRDFRKWCFSEAQKETASILELTQLKCTAMKEYYHKMLQVNKTNYGLSQKVSSNIIEKTEELKEKYKL